MLEKYLAVINIIKEYDVFSLHRTNKLLMFMEAVYGYRKNSSNKL